MDATNDEAIGGHQLYEAGLRDVLWLGVEVVASSLRVGRGTGVSKTAAQSWAWTASKGPRE